VGGKGCVLELFDEFLLSVFRFSVSYFPLKQIFHVNIYVFSLKCSVHLENELGFS
jgi:hypothetical protein